MVRALLMAMVAAVAASGFPQAVPVAAQPLQGPRCGIDLNAPEIALAVQSLAPAFRDIDARWDSAAYGGNVDPCATLSTALVTVERATGSSPNHALSFHYGEYVGTATSQPHPFTALNTAQPTDDTVVLDYKDGRYVCTACAGPMYTVRYHWDGDRVEMLGVMPPSS